MGTVRFGPYEVRVSTRELFKNGMRVKLPPQAFEVLRILVERKGELVTRQEFHRVLWQADTFVDFDQGLNNAVKRIREALNDSSDSPRYVETLPKLGYRFVGTVEPAPAESPDPVAGENTVPDPVAGVDAPARGKKSSRRWIWIGATVSGLALIAAVAGPLAWDRWGATRIHSLAVLPLKNLSSDPKMPRRTCRPCRGALPMRLLCMPV